MASRFLTACLMSGAVACSVSTGPGGDAPDGPFGSVASASAERAVLRQYATIVHASYAASADSAKKLRGAVSTFLSQPSKERFDATKRAWIAARLIYGQTEAYRFYG